MIKTYIKKELSKNFKFTISLNENILEIEIFLVLQTIFH